MGAYKVWMDDDGIIRCVPWGVHLKRDAESITEGVNHISKENGKARVLKDLSKIERSTSSARRIHINNIKTEREIFEKLALIGTSEITRVKTNSMIIASDRGNKARYFESEGEALEWLKE